MSDFGPATLDEPADALVAVPGQRLAVAIDGHEHAILTAEIRISARWVTFADPSGTIWDVPFHAVQAITSRQMADFDSAGRAHGADVTPALPSPDPTPLRKRRTRKSR